MTTIFAVSLGAVIGALMRYGVHLGAVVFLGTFAFYTTLFINALGSFFMGVSYAAIQHNLIPHAARLFLTAGLLSSFTTFSTFSLDLWQLIDKGAFIHAGLYLLLSVALGFSALLLGLTLTQSALS